ncbi:hypothetical protein B0J12DRAFT_372893 [Macrophomina phaseolina]|uniref:Uncharacterized protein n=1 Tax=Macrophomina phaseolina TaxID=35725 RepID=A0ABQ8GKV9_9PEZI|nr:hypothetical protein B0J12DRAFT_372893 [Macrophomina phaseolina]
MIAAVVACGTIGRPEYTPPHLPTTGLADHTHAYPLIARSAALVNHAACAQRARTRRCRMWGVCACACLCFIVFILFYCLLLHTVGLCCGYYAHNETQSMYGRMFYVRSHLLNRCETGGERKKSDRQQSVSHRVVGHAHMYVHMVVDVGPVRVGTTAATPAEDK